MSCGKNKIVDQVFVTVLVKDGVKTRSKNFQRSRRYQLRKKLVLRMDGKSTAPGLEGK